ncbi:uncharacterized protein LOC130645146 isoform X2 [Hydractinia symbiolongicarpus]|nr:uncharacterized protein LOC130645146 isoform X2 [Hydractinia symbiolongicarpus]XP_057307019.1 uncharacterized protein LOC130645146 isoform X2 [Hydractinia symbiolongicarpus]XP_057307020.1 uncharacterized protein LOC130645146 isoform X2 [Hydractinia symbiolongicarpus]
MALIILITLLVLGQLKLHDARMFPTKDFFGVETFKVISHLCSISQQPLGGQKCCDCSDDCMKYKTCCIDKFWDYNTNDRLQPYLKFFFSKLNKYKSMSCEPALSVSQTHAVQTYYMVKSCLPNVTGEDVERCLQPSSHIKNDIPVLGNDTYLYRNLHCARCNLVFDYRFIDVQAKCENALKFTLQKTITKEELKYLDKCEFSLDTATPFKQQNIRDCQIKENVCPQTGSFYKLCNAYGETMGKYKNYHCAMCEPNHIPTEFFIFNITFFQPEFFRNETHNVTIHKTITKQELHPVPVPTPVIDFKCSFEKCQNQHCYLPNGKDSTKFENVFSIVMSSDNVVGIRNFKQKFPIRQFMNISKDYDFRFDEGLEQYLCNAPREKCCDCSDNCMEEKKCCIDKFWNETHPVSLSSYISQFIQKSQKYKDLSCEPVLPIASSSGYQTEHQLMVKSCLPKANVDNVKKCLHDSKNASFGSDLPVQGFDGYIYRNSFCAECNSIKKYKTISVEASCNLRDFRKLMYMNQNNSIELDMESTFKECLFSLPRSSKQSKKCKPMKTLRTDCPRTSRHFKLCHSYKGIIEGFQNYHCWLCNQNNPNITIPPVDYCDTKRCPFGTICVVTEPDFIGRSWSLLISFNNNKFQIGHQSPRSICKNGSKYDTRTLKCEKVICPNGFAFNGKSCSPKIKVLNISSNHYINIVKPTFDKCFFSNNVTMYIVAKKVINDSVKDFLKPLMPYLPKKNISYFVINNTNTEHSVLVLLNVNQSIYTLVESTNVIYNSSLWRNIEKIVITKGDGLQYTEHYKLDMSRYFPQNRICAEANAYNGDEESFKRSCKIKKRNVTFTMQNISMWIDINRTSSKKWYSTCKKFHLLSNCPQRKISDHVSFSKDGDLLNKRIGDIESYKANEYIPLFDGYSVCIKIASNGYIINHKKMETVYHIEYYISLIGTCVSIIAYILMMLSFLIFKQLRTVPGLNTLGMCISLFIADTTFLLAIHSYFSGNWCKIIAVVLHWCLLNAFMWSLIIAFDLISKFSSFTVASRGNSRKKFIRRCLCSLIVPTFIVSLSMTLEETSTLDIGYGVDGICWITSFYSRIGFYVIPVAIIFLITLSTLLYTIRKIHSEFKVNEEILKTGKKTKRETLKIALKLGIILGITEGLGFIQIAKPNLSFNEELFNACFALLYSTFRSLRGLFLCVVYSVGANIAVLYRKKINSFTMTGASESAILIDRHKGINTSSRSDASHTSTSHV